MFKRLGNPIGLLLLASLLSLTGCNETMSITGISPAQGQVGSTVIITGQSFTNISAVYFNGIAAVYKVNSSSQITATVPGGATSGPISIKNTSGTTAKSSASFTVTINKWVLSWSDEFDQVNGSAPDANKWVIETGGDGWGNDELEYYTARPENVKIQNGNLIITALNETYTGPDGTRNYTSARLNTQGKFDQKYGRFEARMKIPSGKGMWPAFWMLGSDYAFNDENWPECGEIDIMENIGIEPSYIYGTIHGPGSLKYADEGLSTEYSLPDNSPYSNEYHIYAIEWEPSVIRFYVDEHLYSTYTPANLSANDKWVFEKPFFMILNLAIGGDWAEAPDETTVFPQQMLVDYVKVYKPGPKPNAN